MIVASRSFADERWLDALVRIAAFVVAAVAPEMFGIGRYRPSGRLSNARAGRCTNWTGSKSTGPSRPSLLQ